MTLTFQLLNLTKEIIGEFNAINLQKGTTFPTGIATVSEELLLSGNQSQQPTRQTNLDNTNQ